MCRGRGKNGKPDICPIVKEHEKNKECILPTNQFWDEIDQFQETVTALLDTQGDKERIKLVIEKMKKLDNKDTTFWAQEHGQVSGRSRLLLVKNRGTTIKHPPILPKEQRERPLKKSKAIEKQVFNNDRYHCRYCGTKIFPKKLFSWLEKEFGDEVVFSKRRKIALKEVHSIWHLCYPVIDHVVPRSVKVKDNNNINEPDMSNLVACCGPCNYGKHESMLEQLGLEWPIPFEKQKRNSEDYLQKWNHFLDRIKKECDERN